jgi:hypothetical protein|nr:MAG TPA: hypothetical protein [Caudoviricetes sp.]
MNENTNIFDDDIDYDVDEFVTADGSDVYRASKWTPDEEDTKSLEELNRSSLGVMVDKDKYVEKEDTTLRDVAEDHAVEDGAAAVDDLMIKTQAIEASKKRLHIVKLAIEDPAEHAAIFAIASDTNTQRRDEQLDARIKAYVEKFPSTVIEWEDGYSPNVKVSQNKVEPVEPAVAEVIPAQPTVKEDHSKEEDLEIISKATQNLEKIPDVVIDKTVVRVNKEDASHIFWDQEDVDKIKKSRRVELDIVETTPLEYNEVVELDENAIDNVLSQYTRKMNDVSSPIPASKYRATFTGLSYPEILDLSQSQELNTVDGLKKKWTIVFNHLKNPSIGQFKPFRYYIDPSTKKKVHLNAGEPVPEGAKLEYGDAFDDFLKKTSFLDLDFMLWKILCATTMESEVISINCHARHNGEECKKEYDWVYSTKNLLDMEKIDPAVLEEMDKTATVSSQQEIEANYKDSFLASSSVITLPHSGFKIMCGHQSAYEHINTIFGKVLEITEAQSPSASDALTVTMLSVVKAVLVPYNGSYAKINSVDGIMKVLKQLDEVDYQTVGEMMRVILEPYQFTYNLRDIVCPKCGNVSNIPIQDMSRMLFIVAQSLMSVQVVLKKN